MLTTTIRAALAAAATLLLLADATADAAIVERNVVLLHKPAAARRALQAVNFRKELVAAVNSKRSERGLRALCINKCVLCVWGDCKGEWRTHTVSTTNISKLMTAAQVMANDMAKNDFVSATGSDGSSPSDRAEAQKYNSTSGVAELVGAGYESARDVMEAWVKSSDTTGTLFGDFTHVGPGYTFNKNQLYWNYWVLDFATGAGNETCADAV